MKQRFMLLGILSALVLGSALPAYALSDAMEDVQYPSPLEQYNAGVALHEIQCNEPRDLYVAGSNVPVCLYQDTYQALLDRGVSLSLPPTLESVVQTVIEDTIALYDSDPDGAFAAISAMMSTDATYPFVLDSDAIVVAHGSNPDVVGIDSGDITIASESVEMIIAELQEGAVWVEYTYHHPVTEAQQYKRALLVPHDGYIFGSGYYVAPESIVRGVVEDAVALYDSDPDGAFATITAAMVNYPSYPFVIDSDGIVVAHGANPNHVGANSVLIESTGKSAEMVISELEDGEMWVEYTFTSPSTGADQHKRSLIMLHDGYIFGSGYYPLPESIVRSVVDKTISSYDSDPDGAFAAITAMMSTDPSYPFVGDSAANLVAHGSNPDLVGQSILTLIKYDMTLETFISELQDGEFWYEYAFHNPATGTEQHKRALFVLHDGHIFGSGYYTAPDDKMTGDAMTDDKMTGDAMTDDKMTGDAMTDDKMTGDAMTDDKMTGDAMTDDKMTGDAMTDVMSSLELTAEETAWLEEKGTIRVAFDPGWLPIEYADEEGNLSGVTLEYVNEFSKLTGVEFAGVPAADSWNDALVMMQNGKADVMYMVATTPERLEYMSFTTSHYTVETSIVTPDDRQATLADEDLVLVTITGYAIEAWLDETHPDVEYTSVANFAEGLELMKTGEANAFAATWPVIVTHAETAGIDVYNAGSTGHEYELNVGYSNESPILGPILQKVVDAIPASQVEQWWNDAVPEEPSLELTAEETAWLEEKGTIRVAFDPGWLPIEYADEEGNLSGVTLEYVNEFSKLTGVEFAGVPAADSWNDALVMMQNGKADVMYMVATTPERLEYMSFTTSHYTVETSIVTPDDRQATLADEDLVLVTITGYAIEAWLDETHPDVEYTSVANFAEGLELMKTGEANAFAATWPVIVTHAETAGIDVYNAGSTGHEYELNVGYSNESPILGPILQKVVDAIPASQVEQWWNDAVQ